MRSDSRSPDRLSDQLRSHRPTQLVQSRSRGVSTLVAAKISDSILESDPDDAATWDPVPMRATISSIERSTDTSDPVDIPAKRN